MAVDATPAHLHRPDCRDQLNRLTSPPRLRHLPDCKRVISEQVRKAAFVVRRDSEVEVPQGRSLERAVAQQPFTGHSIEAGVTA
jgi:hypothetical protein